MEFMYEEKRLEYVGIHQGESINYFTFKHDGEIIWLFQRHQKWFLGWGGNPKFEGKNYEWFGGEKRQKEGEKFADFLFEKSTLRLHFLFEEKTKG